MLGDVLSRLDSLVPPTSAPQLQSLGFQCGLSAEPYAVGLHGHFKIWYAGMACLLNLVRYGSTH
eukprot:SAG31_NODE_5516_length_2483_cov_6.085151_3_plen_64_part_00